MPNEINNIIVQAAKAREANWIKALEILHDGLNEFAGNANLLEAIGDLYLSQKKNKSAIEYYKKANAALAGNENTLHKLANLHMLDSNFFTAKKYLEQITNPSNFPIFKLAVCCIHLKFHTRAISLLESIKDDPNNSEPVLFLLSEEYLTLKYFEKAQALIKSLKIRFPDNDKVTFLWGYYLFCREKFLAAYDHLLRAKEQGFPYQGNIKILAHVARKIGLFSHAIYYYRKALRFTPFDSSIFEEIIKIYMQLGQTDKAKMIAKKIPVFIPKSKKLLTLISSLQN